MTSPVTNVAMSPTPAFANNAEQPMAADGVAAPAGAGPDVSAPGTTTTRDPPRSDDAKSAQVGVQVPNALLGIFIANTSNPATAPLTDPAAAFADFAVNAATSGQSANNQSAGSSYDSSGDPGANAGSAASEASTELQGTSSGPNTAEAASAPVHIIPRWHIIPRMKIV